MQHILKSTLVCTFTNPRLKLFISGQLHIIGLAPEQQQIFIQSIRDQQRQQIMKAQEAQMAKIIPQQQMLQQVPTL